MLLEPTLVSLRAAHIKIYMLTGDHPLTAVSIAYSCGLIDKEFKNVIITGTEFDEICKQLGQVVEEGKL